MFCCPLILEVRVLSVPPVVNELCRVTASYLQGSGGWDGVVHQRSGSDAQTPKGAWETVSRDKVIECTD